MKAMDNKKIAEQHGLTWKGDFFEELSAREKEAGYIKFNIPDPTDMNSPNGEGVWGWLAPEDKAKYDDDTYFGKLNAILCNDPIRYMGLLVAGVEVVIKCNGDKRPILDPEWAAKTLFNEEDESEEATEEEIPEETAPAGRAWRLDDDLRPYDNMLDGFTFDDVICALRTYPKINEASAIEVVNDILSQRMQDLEFLFGNNIDIIIAEARKGREAE